MLLSGVADAQISVRSASDLLLKAAEKLVTACRNSTFNAVFCFGSVRHLTRCLRALLLPTARWPCCYH